MNLPQKILTSAMTILFLIVIGECVFLLQNTPTKTREIVKITENITPTKKPIKANVVDKQIAVKNKLIKQWVDAHNRYKDEHILLSLTGTEYLYEFTITNIGRGNPKNPNHKKFVAYIKFNTIKVEDGFLFTQHEMDIMTIFDKITQKKMVFDDLKKGDRVQLILDYDLNTIPGDTASKLAITKI